MSLFFDWLAVVLLVVVAFMLVKFGLSVPSSEMTQDHIAFLVLGCMIKMLAYFFIFNIFKEDR
jgi:hypothetical protein